MAMKVGLRKEDRFPRLKQENEAENLGRKEEVHLPGLKQCSSDPGKWCV